MSQETTAAAVDSSQSTFKRRVAWLLGNVVFIALLLLIGLTAIPYGTVEPWWKAVFVCAVFSLTILWLVEGWLSGSWLRDGWQLILPLLALAFLAFLQTLSFLKPGAQPANLPIAAWTAISADPYQTRFFILQLLALVLAGLLFLRYANTERRLRIVINVIILVAVASAIFGILRQTTQRGLGFGLPLIMTGYGQFVNKNHFAYLMEMALGLTLGMILGGGVKREKTLIYLAALLPVWTGLVLCGSRGGLLAMLAQIVAAVLLFSGVAMRSHPSNESKAFQMVRSLPVRLALLVVLIGGVVVGTLWVGGDSLVSSIEQSRAELKADSGPARLGVSRNDIWKLTLKMVAANPILGVGMGGYWVAAPTYHDASGVMTPQEAHNDYLELLASGGLAGMAIGIWFAARVIKRTRESLRSTSRFRRAAAFGASIAIVGVAVHSLVDFGLHMMINALVFTTLIVIATSKPSEEDDLLVTS